MKEAKDASEVVVTDVDAQSFLGMLRYIYTDSVAHVTTHSVLGILYAANKYQLDGLRVACLSKIKRTLSPDNVAHFWMSAQLQAEDQLAEDCLNYLRNEPAMFQPGQPGFCSLSLKHLVILLKSNVLPVPEIQVFRATMEWIKRQSLLVSSIRATQKSELLSSSSSLTSPLVSSLEPGYDQFQDVLRLIRFPTMSGKELAQEVAQSGVLTEHQLLQVLLYKASDGEGPPTSFSSQSRWVSRTDHVYRHDFDQNGAIHWIGTRGFARPFENPHISGEVRVTCSPLDCGAADIITSRRCLCCWSSNIPGSWICIDLGKYRKLDPSCYTLRHGYRAPEDGLRNWVLEASASDEDEVKEWETLVVHSHDTCLGRAPYDSHTWPINSRGSSFRRFRIRSTGLDDGGRNFVTINGIELYGTLFSQHNPAG
jgi:hypothetical protein